MAKIGHRFVYRLSKSIDLADGFMFGQGVPWGKRQILSEFHLLSRIERLPGDVDGRDLYIRRFPLIPFDGRVLNWHPNRVALKLHHKIKTGVIVAQIFPHRLAKEVG